MLLLLAAVIKYILMNKPVAGALWGCCIQGRSLPTQQGSRSSSVGPYHRRMSAAVGCHGWHRIIDAAATNYSN